MPDYSGTLKKFRDSGYPQEEDKKDESSSSGVRNIKLTEDEARELQPYQEKFGSGQEMVIEATGELEGTTFRITGGVRYAQGGEEQQQGEQSPDMNADAQELMSKFK